MQTEKQRERLVELITEFETNNKVRCPKYAEPTCEGCEYDLGDECDKTSILADYLMSNNVVVLPENALVEVKPRIVYEDKASAIVEEEYVITWENKRKLLKEKEMSNGT